MNERDALRLALLNVPGLAKLAGVSVHTIRAILKPSGAQSSRSRLYPATRAKLAAALRQHAATLSSLADQLEHKPD